MSSKRVVIDTFKLQPGERLAGKYVVGERLGSGWEGEVYHVEERNTGIERAAKLFFPQRNPNNGALRFYAKKLEKLRECDMVMRYHTQDSFRFNGTDVHFLISEYIHGELLADMIKRQPGKRLTVFQAISLLHTLACGVEQIHRKGEYHGDLHDGNIIVRHVGIGYQVKIVDFYHWGRCTREHMHDDLCALIRILYDSLGGARHYPKQPEEVKDICKGLKRSLLTRKYRIVAHLRHHLETIEWSW